jgi:hypothetical protein
VDTLVLARVNTGETRRRQKGYASIKATVKLRRAWGPIGHQLDDAWEWS